MSARFVRILESPGFRRGGVCQYVDVEGLTVQETNDGETFDWMCKKLKNMFEAGQIPQEQIDTIVKSLKYNDKGDIK